MAILLECGGCGNQIMVSVNDPIQLCDACKQKQGIPVPKKWEDMTLEEKVEDLNCRLSQGFSHFDLYG